MSYHVPPPSVSPEDKSSKPIVKDLGGENPRWSFSWRFWRQIECFGISQEEKSWFSSLLECLSALSNYKIEEVTVNRSLSSQWRFHKINWNQHKIPIKKEDLNWIPADYLSSPDYEFYQFQISKGKGRVVGFFDERRVFNIILLDPKHNIQPSKDFDYRIRETHILKSSHAVICETIERAKYKANCGSNCPVVKELSPETEWMKEMNLISFKISSEDYEMSVKVFDSKLADSHESIYSAGVLYLHQDIKD